jgi:cellulose synthase/poly-beta-1,6-N-acetylglucosamine synthase-like glycosyltransferase
MRQDLFLMSAILRGRRVGELIGIIDDGSMDENSVDVLHRLAIISGCGEVEVMSRAADWAGLAFIPEMPKLVPNRVEINGLEPLGRSRALFAPFAGRHVFFIAPRFDEFVALRNLLTHDPGLARYFCVVPQRSLTMRLVEASGERLAAEARGRLRNRWPLASAAGELRLPMRIGFALLMLALVVALGLAPLIDRLVLMPLTSLLLVVPGVMRLAAVAAPRKAEPVPVHGSGPLPVYTVLVPLRDEAHMVAPLANALRRLDYPADRLDIIFAVEGDSTDTLSAVRAELTDPRFRLVAIPPGSPRTKPKAMDFVLPLARGDYLAVYDAEDVPDPQQLRLAAARFAEEPEIDCLQAELVVDNGGDNALTALFAGEYAGQFGLMLPLLARFGLPMPLGGTSNHFRVAALKEVGGWDAYNVTEDADLGVRFARLRYRTATLQSHTGEEVPHRLGPWLRQRTRWMKGWMQTLIVHNRHPRAFLGDIGWRGFLAFQIYVGSLILSGPLHLMFLVALAISALGRGSGPPDLADGIVLMALFIGYGGPILLALAGLERLGRRDLFAAQVLLPIYWLLHALAAALALIDLVRRPYFWAKTAHGTGRPPKRSKLRAAQRP